MIDLLQRMAFRDILILLFCVFALIAMLIALLAYVIKKAGITKLYGLERKEKEEGSIKSSPHSTCLHSKDILILLTKQADMLDEVHTLERRVLKEQLIFVKSEAARLRGKAQGLFLKLLFDTIGTKDGLVDHCDYRTYVSCLKEIIADAKEQMAIFFEENHYSERTESEFRTYVAGRVSEVIQGITDYLNEAYTGTLITREELYDFNHRHVVKELDDSLEKMFWSAREIAVRTKDKCTALREEFDVLVKKHL